MPLNFRSPHRTALTWVEGAAHKLKSGSYGRHLMSGGRKRWYELYVPPSYKAENAVPLVLVFHGGAGNPDQQRHDSVMDQLADEKGFAVAYPAGTGPFSAEVLLSWNARVCCGYAAKQNVDDVGFVREMLDDISQLISTDPSSIYATGLSNGALMCYMLASELPDRIAAIAPVAAAMKPSDKAKGTPIPIMHFHGQLDENAPVAGGTGSKSIAGFEFLPLKDSFESWLAYNRCPKEPASTTKIGAAVIQTYDAKPGGAPMVLCMLMDGGHTWPGGKMTDGEVRMGLGHINQDVSASRMMWDFFSSHSLGKR